MEMGPSASLFLNVEVGRSLAILAEAHHEALRFSFEIKNPKFSPGFFAGFSNRFLDNELGDALVAACEFSDGEGGVLRQHMIG